MSTLSRFALSFVLLPILTAADVPGSKDAPGMRRYAGSEIIGYRAPKFDEFLLPLGPPKEFTPPSYEKSLKTEGLVSRYTYAGARRPHAHRALAQLQARIRPPRPGHALRKRRR